MNKIFYINLDSRKDRKKLCEEQMDKLDWKYERFPAINHTNGAIGCATSHLRILEKAKQNKLPYVIIFEDDFEITDYKLFKTQFKKILDNRVPFDVLKFGANPFPPYKYIKDTHVGLNMSFTTHGYMVKQHYYDKLIINLQDSIDLLLKEGRGYSGINCCDVRMNILTQKDNWILLTPICCIQRTGHSDIENQVVDYPVCKSLKLDKNTIFIESEFCIGEEKKNYFKKKYGDISVYNFWCNISTQYSKALVKKNTSKSGLTSLF